MDSAGEMSLLANRAARSSTQSAEEDLTVKKRFKGFTLIELLVVIAIIALLISILLPSLSRARELSKRLVCASNIKGIGTSCKIYANENSEKWPVPPFKQSAIDNENIDYLPSADENDTNDPGAIGFNRWLPSYSEVGRITSGASTAISVTRAYWMLVRTGDVTVKQYVCPSGGDNEDPTENLELYYDFTGFRNISYGYQVPYGPRDTQPREGMDNRQALAADKGPFYTPGPIATSPQWKDSNNQELTTESSPESWQNYNSGNHGGKGQGEGQNVLYADGHASFIRTPLAGIDSDNIYTTIENQWDDVRKFNLIHGETPHEVEPAPYPGMDAMGSGAGAYSSTDTLIFP
jgi:prepilin-type N-terminal cleavage/methylation domain-containing protein/prepilin-type processing-associated H-X9-DG protein